MPHGKPIWQKAQAKHAVHEWSDLDELAARLGSPMSFDRRGDVIFIDTFKDGLSRWDTFEGGDGAAVDLSAATARSGQFSARIVAGSTSPYYSYMTKFLGYPTLSKMGLEISFAVPGTLTNFMLRFRVFDGTKRLWFAIQWVRASDELQIMDDTPDWTKVLDTEDLYEEAQCFHTLKLVVDPVNKVYVRGLLDSQEVDLSPYSVNEDTDPTYPSVELFIYAEGPGGVTATLYVDDIIVTQSEI